MKKHLFILSFLFFTVNIEAKLTLKEIRTVSNNILVVLFTSDTLNLSEVNIKDSLKWILNGKPVKRIWLYSTKQNACAHHVYMETDILKEGSNYQLETPHGSINFKFSDHNILCESIKTNQGGYSSLSKVRFAYFNIWIGTGGSKKIEGTIPEYEVFAEFSKKKVISGKLFEAGFDSSSGDFVYKIDLSKVPEGGPYKIAVKGYGCSYPFGVGGEFMKKTAYVLFRGQYYQRCGCPIDSPSIREKACHSLIYKVNGPIGEANIAVKGDEPTFKCYGGYHDAGDADRRAYHIANPIINLMIYEAFPDKFYDGQFDIPGKFDADFNILSKINGIPDIIDEAEWGTLVWKYLQNDDGSIQFGTETKGYPEPFAAPLDKDTKKYGTVKLDPRATCTSAGLFLHLARLIKSYKPDLSQELIQRAEKAMDFGKKDMAKPEQLYYYIQKYLITKNNEDHQRIKELYKIADSLKYFLFSTPGYSLNNKEFDNPAYIYSYIIAKDVKTDPQIVEYFRKAIIDAADLNVIELSKHVFPVGNDSRKGGWGHNIRQNMYACAPLLAWNITKQQKYMDAASQLMDYKLGLNPMGISFVTGIGFYSVTNPHDRESAYTILKGWGPKPGITVFGPGITGWSRRGSSSIPDVKNLAFERRYVDDLDVISFNEFTIFETMAHDALYTVLSNGGKWNGKNPFAKKP